MKKRVFFLLVAALIMPWAMKAQVNSAVHIDSTLSKCDSYTWSVNGQTYTTSTVVTYVSGDTLYILDLTINQSVTNTITEPISGGCTFQWGNNTYTENGTYTQTFTGSNGCDSTVTLTLNLTSSAAVTYDVTACDNYSFKGETYNTSGTYNITDESNPLCDSIITLNLTVLPIDTIREDITVVACESTVWRWSPEESSTVINHNCTINSNEYSQSTAATRRLFHPRTAERCFDSTVYVTFNIKQHKRNNITERGCDSYTFHFSMQTSDTTSTDTTLYFTFSKTDSIRFAHAASNGCDSIIIANITINKSPVITISGDLRVTPGSNCTLRALSDQANTVFTWADGSHDTVYTRNNVTENFDTYVNGKNPSSGCEHTSYVTVLANASINSADDNAINVYPNPTSGVININSNEVVKNITVFNMNGQQMINAKNVNSVDLSVLAKGTYVVRVDLESGKIATRTIVVSK